MNGISAIKGFDYQATVALDLLLDHFDQHGTEAWVRPEGIDDLDLTWTEGTEAHKLFVQVKKPTEDEEGNLNPSPWTLSAVIRELLPNTLTHLAGNNARQLWVVGDECDSEVTSLIEAGADAPVKALGPYMRVLHGLSRAQAVDAADLKAEVRQKLLRWRIPAGLPQDPVDALAKIVSEYQLFVRSKTADTDLPANYARTVEEVHRKLPGILSRVQAKADFGTEREIAERVTDHLKRLHRLDRKVIEGTLFKNLRGFISDISKQPGRRFDKAEFEFELLSVWPRAVPIRDVPSLEPDHVKRLHLTDKFTTRWTARSLEAIGISGSGKTSLIAEIVERSRDAYPNRHIVYVEVRPDTDFRDLCVGVAFYLRRIGFVDGFQVAVKSGPADEEAIKCIARIFSTIQSEVVVLIDLVKGTCNDVFARDLATMVRALTSDACRIAVFGQVSAMRELTASERDELRVERIDIPGFQFGEFVKLVAHYHPGPDRQLLHSVHERLTAGRPAGLFAALARSLARAETLAQMSELAKRNPEDALALAEHSRFSLLSVGARSTAEKLVCFDVPFRRADAQEILPDDNVGLAIRELMNQGLLRLYDPVTYEMHETVRAGLESSISQNVRRSTHGLLAEWYAKKGMLSAQILCLEKVGESNQARELAREAFLRGEDWRALSSYVVGRRLVSAQEVIGVISRNKAITEVYLLPEILKDLGEPDTDSQLMQVLRATPERLYSDVYWAIAVTTAVVQAQPSRLDELIGLVVQMAQDLQKISSGLNMLLVAAGRRGQGIGPATLALFDAQPDRVKRLMVGFLLRDRRRDVLRKAFAFLERETAEVEASAQIWRQLHIIDSVDATELLAAITPVAPARMLATGSALLGTVAPLIWPQRKLLRQLCAQIIRDNSAEELVLQNAIRVLVFLAEPSIGTLCEKLIAREDSVGALAKAVPALAPAFFDRDAYEEQLFNPEANYTSRVGALFVLGALGTDLTRTRNRLLGLEVDVAKRQGWDIWFLQLALMRPFEAVIPALERLLAATDPNVKPLIISLLLRIGELPGATAGEVLIRALGHPDREVRRSAVRSLTHRRSRAALAPLMDMYAQEEQEGMALDLAGAITACGPRAASDLRGKLTTPTLSLWRCVLAMRVRDASAADCIVRIATDPTAPWRLRRAAIYCAGRLPFEAALEKVLPTVMKERSPLTLDTSANLDIHATMCATLAEMGTEVSRLFAGRLECQKIYGAILDECWDGASTEKPPSGEDAAGWLFDRLVFHGFPQNTNALEEVLNEVNVPMLHYAVVRSLRMCNRPDLIEAQLGDASYDWLAMKCLSERFRAGSRDSDLTPRLKQLVERSPCKGSGLLHRVIVERAKAFAATMFGVVPNRVPEPKPAPVVRTHSFEEAVGLLAGTLMDSDSKKPFILDAISREQCEKLISLAHPDNDRDYGVETYVPWVRFTVQGYVTSHKTTTHSGESPYVNIRAAIAAANIFGLPNPWHEDLMTGALAATHIPKFLWCLGAMNNGDRFYEALDLHEDVIIPFICNQRTETPVLSLVDARIVPSLERYSSGGTDEQFNGLCALARRIETPEVDRLLSMLLRRWTQRFTLGSTAFQHENNHPLWQGWSSLSRHPRFDNIEGWQTSLAQVLSAPMSWGRSDEVVKVLERSPRSYLIVEQRLLKSCNWLHRYVEVIDRLDEAAEILFKEVNEC